MTRAATIESIFELSISLERAAEEFYRGLAVRFAHEADVAMFWNKYADEEAGHARWLETLRGQLDAAKLRQVLDGTDAMVDEAYRLLADPPEKLLAGISNLEEAYRTAVVLENSETNTIFEFLVTDFSMSHRSRDFLHEQIHNHVEKINKGFPPAFQDTASRLRVKAAG